MAVGRRSIWRWGRDSTCNRKFNGEVLQEAKVEDVHIRKLSSILIQKVTCQENASSNDWLVYLAGGGWCYDLESCEGRFNGSNFPHQACSSSNQSKPCFMSSKDLWWVMVVENDLPPKWMVNRCLCLQWKLLLESCWMKMMSLIQRLAFSLHMWQDYPPACGKSLGSFSSLTWSPGFEMLPRVWISRRHRGCLIQLYVFSMLPWWLSKWLLLSYFLNHSAGGCWQIYDICRYIYGCFQK